MQEHGLMDKGFLIALGINSGGSLRAGRPRPASKTDGFGPFLPLHLTYYPFCCVVNTIARAIGIGTIKIGN